jgi:hypothetical protein
MQLLIDRGSGLVTVNGKSHFVDCTSIQPEIDQVKWFGDNGTVHYRDGDVVDISDIDRFRLVIDEWRAKQKATRTRNNVG